MATLTDSEKLLLNLIKIHSISGDLDNSLKVIKYVADYLNTFSLYIKQFNDNGYPILLATTKQTTKPEILFLAHGDVVTADDQDFEPKVSRDKIYGRGALDMKFAIAAYLNLFNELHKSRKLTNLNIGLAITTDEESRNKNIDFLLDEVSPGCAVLLDGASDWNLEASSKGAWTVLLSLKGETAHGSRPWEGDSATERLINLLAELKTAFEPLDKADATLNITNLHSKGAINQVPDNASVCLDIRYKDRSRFNKIKKRLTALCHKYRVKLKVLLEFEPVIHDTANLYLRSFNKSVENVLKLSNNQEVVSFGASEASSLSKRGIPTIVSRPSGGGAHSKSEWVDRQSFNYTVSILTQFIDLVSQR